MSVIWEGNSDKKVRTVIPVKGVGTTAAEARANAEASLREYRESKRKRWDDDVKARHEREKRPLVESLIQKYVDATPGAGQELQGIRDANQRIGYLRAVREESRRFFWAAISAAMFAGIAAVGWLR